MSQPIPRSAHGVLDYVYAAALAASPFLFGFTHVREASLAAWAFAAVVLIVTLLTRFEAGVWRVVPYRMHLLGDVLGNVLMLAAPWMLGFADESAARNTFLGFGLLGLVAVALSRTDEMGSVRTTA